MYLTFNNSLFLNRNWLDFLILRFLSLAVQLLEFEVKPLKKCKVLLVSLYLTDLNNYVIIAMLHHLHWMWGVLHPTSYHPTLDPLLGRFTPACIIE